MALCDDVRTHCARIAGSARSVTIDVAALSALDAAPAATLDGAIHYLDGPREAVARYLLTLDSINFGSGWFPVLAKRPGCSGYTTVAANLSDRFRADGPWSNAELGALDTRAVAAALGQSPDLELMAIYAEAFSWAVLGPSRTSSGPTLGGASLGVCVTPRDVITRKYPSGSA